MKNLPGGFETEIGERGIKLSGGQRQFSRSPGPFKNAPILILDESTSNLDTASEVLVFDALQRLMQERTTIIIAHRLSTVVQAESIVVLECGRIVQQGTHEELLQVQAGLYYRLYANSLLTRDTWEPSAGIKDLARAI